MSAGHETAVQEVLFVPLLETEVALGVVIPKVPVFSADALLPLSIPFRLHRATTVYPTVEPNFKSEAGMLYVVDVCQAAPVALAIGLPSILVRVTW